MGTELGTAAQLGKRTAVLLVERVPTGKLAGVNRFVARD
jgi:hypothetical protein